MFLASHLAPAAHALEIADSCNADIKCIQKNIEKFFGGKPRRNLITTVKILEILCCDSPPFECFQRVLAKIKVMFYMGYMGYMGYMH